VRCIRSTEWKTICHSFPQRVKTKPRPRWLAATYIFWDGVLNCPCENFADDVFVAASYYTGTKLLQAGAT
jgi:hypothetical protein